jgi:hypothetical protein
MIFCSAVKSNGCHCALAFVIMVIPLGILVFALFMPSLRKKPNQRASERASERMSYKQRMALKIWPLYLKAHSNWSCGLSDCNSIWFSEKREKRRKARGRCDGE